MSLEEIIQQILLSRKDLTHEEVLRRIEEKKEAAEGYFTDETAARIVAQELGVEVSRETFRPEVLIRDLVSGLNNVTVTGRVIIVYPLQAFTRPDKTEGKVARLLVADKSGTVRIVLWDDKASLVEAGKLEQGQIIKVLHGYVREGLDGKLELHLGLRGDVQISPPDIVERDYPPITHFLEKIGKITRKHKKVNILGVVQNVYPPSEFKRRNGTYGKVMRLELRDETGQIIAVLWNEKVDELKDVKKGDYIQVMNARIKERLDGGLELHVENATRIETLAETPPHYEPTLAFPAQLIKVKELGPGMRDVNILARVMHVGEVREFKRPSGEEGRVSTLLIKDETDSIYLNLWEDKATLSQQIRPGDVLLATGSYTRERLGKIDLNVGKQGLLALNPAVTEVEKLPPYVEEKVKIAEIKEEGGPVTLEGTVTTTPTIREVVTSQEEKVTVASFELTDDTGKIRVSVWRKLANIVKDLSAGTRIKIKNAYIKRGFSNQLELTSRMLTSIEILSKPEESSTKETS